MKDFELYIFNNLSKASNYGIGTYLEQLKIVLRRQNIKFTVISLTWEISEITIRNENGFRQLYIPLYNENPFLPGDLQENRFYRNIAYVLKEFIPDKASNIFHLNSMANKTLAASLKKVFKGKVILSVHYTDWSFNLLGNYELLKELLASKKARIKEELYRKTVKEIEQDRRMLKKCDHIICIAQHSRNFIKEIYGISDSKISLINYGLLDCHQDVEAEEKLRIRQKYYIFPDEKIIFFAGRLDEIKGLRYIIKALELVIKQHPNVHLFIAGDGDFNAHINESSGFWSRISFMGRLDKEQLYEFYRIADIGIVSSLHEEFGLVVTEMMMHGLPVITSDTGGPAEQIEDNISGLKVPVRLIENKRIVDSGILAENIQFLIDNPDKAEKLGINARKRFLEKYELSIFERNILNFYRNI